MKLFVKIEYYLAKIFGRFSPRAIKNSKIHFHSSVGAGTQFIESEMSKHSFCGRNCQILNTRIGSFCSIANYCVIGADEHSLKWVSTSPVFNKNREQIKFKYSKHEFTTRTSVLIGHDVWLGEKVSIKSGVNIGTGAVIGAGSVVTKNVPEYEIWGGVPAKFIRRRFDKELSDKLLESAWWELDDNKLKRLAVYIKDPGLFLQKIDEL